MTFPRHALSSGCHETSPRSSAPAQAGTRSWEELMSRVMLTLVAFVALLLGPASLAAAAEGSAGAVYTLTNSAANAVISYDRSASGALTWSGTFPTGGVGGPLGSQGSVVTSDDGRWLYAVDAGSNDIAVFKIAKDGLEWSDRIASGGLQPVSVTTSDNLVYVVNAASSSIAGFRSNDGQLSPIAGSIRTFAADNDGALTLAFAQAAHSTGAHTTDMGLTKNSEYLYANDGGTHMISAFRVGADGSLTRLLGVTIPVGASGLAAR